MVRVARRGDLTVAEVASDFDISVESVRRWMRQADIDDGVRDGLTSAEQTEVVRLRRENRRLAMENEVLRRAAAYLAKDTLVCDLAAQGIPVRLTCGVLGFSPQAFYRWNRQPVCDRDWDDANLTNAIVDAHGEDPTLGYRFIADELERAGHVVCERRVWRLCRQQRVWSTITKKGRKSAGKTPGPAVYDDHVHRHTRTRSAASADAPPP